MGEVLARQNKVIDYDDMLWLPHRWHLSPPTFDWVFVDEAQDLNEAHQSLILKTLDDELRALVVGDPNQSIYGLPGQHLRV